MTMAGDNFWDQYDPRSTKPADPQAAAVPASDPPPASEDDYGANATNVVPLKPPRKRKETNGTGGGGDGAPPGDGGDSGWRGRMHTSESGSPLPNLFNVLLLLRNVPQFIPMLAYDMMASEPVISAHIPGTADEPRLPRSMRDEDVVAIQETLQDQGLRRVAKSVVQDACMARAWERRYHPVRDYLAGLKWDGETRIDGWLSRYMGVEGTPYTDKIGRLFLIAMIARIMRPGCKADYMLILEGLQGLYKSTACAVLAGEQWFSDSLPDLKSGDQVRLSMHVRGKWLIEIGELASFSNSQTEDLKAFLSRRDERYIPKFGRYEVTEPRTALFVGTTNETAYLKDSTGARRFWPVVIGTIDIDALTADRDQLFAEALLAFKSGEKWHPEKEFEDEHIKPEQQARYEADVWQQQIEAWLAVNAHWRVTVSEVMRDALALPSHQMTVREQRRVSAILKQLGWKRNDKNSRHPYENPARRQPSFDV